MRREFSLPQFDVDYLNTLGLQWETLGGAGGTHWLLIHEWPIKAGVYPPVVTSFVLRRVAADGLHGGLVGCAKDVEQVVEAV